MDQTGRLMFLPEKIHETEFFFQVLFAPSIATYSHPSLRLEALRLIGCSQWARTGNDGITPAALNAIDFENDTEKRRQAYFDAYQKAWA